MGLDLQQRIAQVQQKIGVKDAAGKSTTGLQNKLAKLLNKLGAANTAAGVAVTLGIAAFVIPSGDASSGGADTATPPGASVVGSESGGGLVWGVTVGDEPATPGDSASDNHGTSKPDHGSPCTPVNPEVAPPDSGSSESGSTVGSSTGNDAGSSSGGATDAEGQDTTTSGGSSTGGTDTTESDDVPPEEEDGE